MQLIGSKGLVSRLKKGYVDKQISLTSGTHKASKKRLSPVYV